MTYLLLYELQLEGVLPAVCEIEVNAVNDTGGSYEGLLEWSVRADDRQATTTCQYVGEYVAAIFHAHLFLQ